MPKHNISPKIFSW